MVPPVQSVPEVWVASQRPPVPFTVKDPVRLLTEIPFVGLPPLPVTLMETNVNESEVTVPLLDPVMLTAVPVVVATLPISTVTPLMVVPALVSAVAEPVDRFNPSTFTTLEADFVFKVTVPCSV